jgi:hypothetical protein
MFEKKHANFKTPNLRELQEVIIDARTKIYIALGADPEEAKSRYFIRQENKNKVLIFAKKPAAPIVKV